MQNLDVDTLICRGRAVFLGDLALAETGTLTVQGVALALGTTEDTLSVHLNSRSYTQPTGTFYAARARPLLAATTAGTLYGGQAAPQVADAVAITGTGAVVGFDVAPNLQGTTGNLAADFRGLDVELLDAAGSVRTITGDVVGLRLRSAMECTVSGDVAALRVDAGEKATAWNCFVKFSAAQANLVADRTSAGIALSTLTSGGNKVGWIRVKIGAAFARIPLFTDASP